MYLSDAKEKDQKRQICRDAVDHTVSHPAIEPIRRRREADQLLFAEIKTRRGKARKALNTNWPLRSGAAQHGRNQLRSSPAIFIFARNGVQEGMYWLPKAEIHLGQDR